MDIKEALRVGRVFPYNYKELIVVEKLLPALTTWWKYPDSSYGLDVNRGKYYDTDIFGDRGQVLREKVSLSEVDFEKCPHFHIGLDIIDLIRLCENIDDTIYMTYVNKKWDICTGFSGGNSKSFKDALMDFLFEYVCFGDNTIFRP